MDPYRYHMAPMQPIQIQPYPETMPMYDYPVEAYHEQMPEEYPIQMEPHPIKPSQPAGPMGLQHLAIVDRLVCSQEIEMMEILTGYEGANRYNVYDACGQLLFCASEESDACQRQCHRSRRGFILHVVDLNGRENIRVVRRFKSCSNGFCACWACCQDECTVECPPGTSIAFIRQMRACNATRLRLEQPKGTPRFRIEGPNTCCLRFSDIVFRVKDFNSSTEIGQITRKYDPVLQLYTKADNFTINFPQNLDVKMKAAMLGALFLVDFMAFEEEPPDNPSF